jgi:hypothetical protein
LCVFKKIWCCFCRLWCTWHTFLLYSCVVYNFLMYYAYFMGIVIFCDVVCVVLIYLTYICVHLFALFKILWYYEYFVCIPFLQIVIFIDVDVLIIHLCYLYCCNPSLGLVTKVRDCKGAGQEGSSGVWESVREWTLTFPSELPFWELESQWTPKSSKSNCGGQNPLSWNVIYISGIFLECRCP